VELEKEKPLNCQVCSRIYLLHALWLLCWQRDVTHLKASRVAIAAAAINAQRLCFELRASSVNHLSEQQG